MSFAVRFSQLNKQDYEKLEPAKKDKDDNASKAQLNVAEYEGIFIAVFLFFYTAKLDGILVTIVSIVVPIAQAVYFWGRALSGSAMPWAPIGTLPRYASLLFMTSLLASCVTASK